MKSNPNYFELWSIKVRLTLLEANIVVVVVIVIVVVVVLVIVDVVLFLLLLWFYLLLLITSHVGELASIIKAGFAKLWTPTHLPLNKHGLRQPLSLKGSGNT